MDEDKDSSNRKKIFYEMIIAILIGAIEPSVTIKPTLALVMGSTAPGGIILGVVAIVAIVAIVGIIGAVMVIR